jgi:hypothetical protein
MIESEKFPNMELRTGVTTRRDVVAAWGNPQKTSGDVWICHERTPKGGKVKASYVDVRAGIPAAGALCCGLRT